MEYMKGPLDELGKAVGVVKGIHEGTTKGTVESSKSCQGNTLMDHQRIWGRQ